MFPFVNCNLLSTIPHFNCNHSFTFSHQLLSYLNYFPLFTFPMLYFPIHLQLSLIYFSSCLLFTFIHHSCSTIIPQLVRANHPDAHSSHRLYRRSQCRIRPFIPLISPGLPVKTMLAATMQFLAVYSRFKAFSISMYIYTFYAITLLKSSLFLL